MSNLMPNENARAHLIASLEWGVSPLMPADLYANPKRAQATDAALRNMTAVLTDWHRTEGHS